MKHKPNYKIVLNIDGFSNLYKNNEFCIRNFTIL